MLWPRPRSLSAMCPPCVPQVRFGPASKPGPVCASCLCLAWVHHVSARCLLCQLRSTMCPRLWTLAARGLLWGIMKYKILFQHCATRRVYIACLLVSFLGIHFGSQIRPLQAHPMLDFFWVYAGIIKHKRECPNRRMAVWLVAKGLSVRATKTNYTCLVRINEFTRGFKDCRTGKSRGTYSFSNRRRMKLLDLTSSSHSRFALHHGPIVAHQGWQYSSPTLLSD